MIGIYCIKNIVTNKVYIGSSINTNLRRRNHFSALRKNKHHSKHLQRTFNKYGEEIFEFIVLETFNDISRKELRKIELQYIKKFDSYHNGYNVSKRTDCPSLEEPWNKGKKFKEREGKNHPRSRAIVGLDKEGRLIKEFESISLANKYYNNRSIGQCLAKKSIRAHNLYWFYKTDYIKNNFVIAAPKTTNNEKEVLKLDLNGKILDSYVSVSEASKQNNADTRSISSCCRNNSNRISILGFIYVFKDDFNKKNFKIRHKIYSKAIPISMVKDGVKIKDFNSISEASKYIGCNHSFIAQVKDTNRKAYGYNWVTNNN